MDTLTPGYSLHGFFDRARKSSSRILMLDYDGTLAPFRVERDRAYPFSGVRERLADIQGDSKTRLIIISGRAVDDVRPLLGLDPPPEIWGSHGAERYVPGKGTELFPLPERTSKGLGAVLSWASKNDLGNAIERKPAGIAFHFRALEKSDRKKIMEKLDSQWSDKVADLGLEWHEFDGGVEMRASGISKADAVQSVLKESGDSVIAYLGDDLTDEDAFEALDGKGLRVLVREQMRDTLADIRLTPPVELLEFLDRWCSLSKAQD
jgi:trehalose 6-phosphate phosphatase